MYLILLTAIINSYTGKSKPIFYFEVDILYVCVYNYNLLFNEHQNTEPN